MAKRWTIQLIFRKIDGEKKDDANADEDKKKEDKEDKEDKMDEEDKSKDKEEGEETKDDKDGDKTKEEDGEIEKKDASPPPKPRPAKPEVEEVCSHETWRFLGWNL